MRWSFVLSLVVDGVFVVTARRLAVESDRSSRPKVTTFSHEDEFLTRLVWADLGPEPTLVLAKAVLQLRFGSPVSPETVVDLLPQQIQELFQYGDTFQEGHRISSGGDDLQAIVKGCLPRLDYFLMQAPTAVAVLAGAEHRLALLNDRYAEVIGITSPAKLIGKAISETDLGRGNPALLDILERVYATGRPWSGRERSFSFYREASSAIEERHFDVTYQPLTNSFGEVCGIILQISDVTDFVLARSVLASREELLYRQWAELEVLYRNSPIGLLLIDATDLRIRRLNQKKAETLGASMAALLGTPLLNWVRFSPELQVLFGQVMAGEQVVDHVFQGELVSSPSVRRQWLVNIAPILSSNGIVEAVTFASLELPCDSDEDAGEDAARKFVFAL